MWAAPAVRCSGARNCPTLHWGRSKSLHNPVIMQRLWLWFLPTSLHPNTVKANLRTTAAESSARGCFQPGSPSLHRVIHACTPPIFSLIYYVSPQFAANKEEKIGVSEQSLFSRILSSPKPKLSLICILKYANYFRTVWLTRDRHTLWGRAALHDWCGIGSKASPNTDAKWWLTGL